jgi:hypothetical protein
MKALKVRIQYNQFNIVEYEYPSIASAKKVLGICDTEKATAIKHAIKRQQAVNKFVNENTFTLSADEFVKGVESIIKQFGTIDYIYKD